MTAHGMCGRIEIIDSARHFRIRIATSNSNSSRILKLRRSLILTLLSAKPMLGRQYSYAWPFSVFTPKQVFGPRTAKSQPIWIIFCTHLLLYGTLVGRLKPRSAHGWLQAKPERLCFFCNRTLSPI